jgi:glyoxylase-like metal-dependent hydrolase (beta-lactamase superfamily II)
LQIEFIEVRTPFSVGTVNCYAIEDGGLTLVDAGPASDESFEDLSAGLARIGRRIEDVELLLLTHQHADHAGGAAHVKELSGCVVAGHELLVDALADAPRAAAAEAAYQASLMRVHGTAPDVIEEALAIERRFHHYLASVEVAVRLRSGPVPGAPGIDVRERPGHSPTDLVYAADRHGVAFTGDHVLASFPSIPLIHRPPGQTDDRGVRSSTLLTYRRSLAATAADPTACGLPGHGAAIDDTTAIARKWLDAHERRAARIAVRMGPEPVTAFEIVQELWRDVGAARSYLRLCEVLGTLDFLEERGAVSTVSDSEQIRYVEAVQG